MERQLDSEELLINTLNAIPFTIMVVDEDVRVRFWNKKAAEVMGPGPILRQRGGEILHCINATLTPEGCGHATQCKVCVVRNSVKAATNGRTIVRQKTIMELGTGTDMKKIPFLITASPFEMHGEKLAVLVLEDIRELLHTEGLVPICSKCKKIRTSDTEWMPIEEYVKTNLVDVNFTHGICKECAATLYPSFARINREPT